MIITKEVVTTTIEKISVRMDDSRVSVPLDKDKEKETELIAAILEVAEKELNLNTRKG